MTATMMETVNFIVLAVCVDPFYDFRNEEHEVFQRQFAVKP